MIMKITNGKLMDFFRPSLKELFTIPTNSKVAYNIAKTAKNVDVAIMDYQLAEKNIIESRCIIESGKPKTKNNEYVFANESIENEAKDEVLKLKNSEIEIEVFPISIAEIGNAEISAKVIYGLGEFIKE